MSQYTITAHVLKSGGSYGRYLTRRLTTGESARHDQPLTRGLRSSTSQAISPTPTSSNSARKMVGSWSPSTPTAEHGYHTSATLGLLLEQSELSSSTLPSGSTAYGSIPSRRNPPSVAAGELWKPATTSFRTAPCTRGLPLLCTVRE